MTARRVRLLREVARRFAEIRMTPRGMCAECWRRFIRGEAVLVNVNRNGEGWSITRPATEKPLEELFR